eukprot:jgi/Chlat1/7127/Chrsp57S06809
MAPSASLFPVVAALLPAPTLPTRRRSSLQPSSSRPAAAAGLKPGLKAAWQPMRRRQTVAALGGFEVSTTTLWILAFSATPFLAVKALAGSDLGRQLNERMQRRKAEVEAAKPEVEAAQAEAREGSPWYGSERPKFMGPIDWSYPSWLDGTAPGDYGYDWLGLAKEPKAFDRNFEFEILHSRWAMLGALGVVIPEILQYTNASQFSESVWWKVGKAKLEGDTLDYLGIEGLHIAGAQGVLIIAICQVFLMLGPEYARACGINALEPLGIYLPGDKNYPGGVFDPLRLTSDPASFEELKVKELKNGRLAMVAWAGFYAQAVVTQDGPVKNLLDFLADPAHNNVLKYLR